MSKINNKDLFVSVIIPCRNEEKFIASCLNSIIYSDYSQERIEVMVVDGMSNDKTREIVSEFSEKYPHIRLIDNPKKIVPTALNIGIRDSKGQVIMRMDAHNIYDKQYISKCIKYLLEYSVDNVGGVCITLPENNNAVSKSIAIALSHRFGVGNSSFRIGSDSIKYVDTIPFGCYKREVFDKIGYFDEELIRNQDDEFNLRLIKSGGKILLSPDIFSYYYARDSLTKLLRMYFQYGYFKPLVVRKLKAILTWRQLVPALFVSALLIFGIISIFEKQFLMIPVSLVSVYMIINMFATIHIGINKGIGKYLLLVPLTFAVIHFSYGIGYLKGIVDFILLNKYRRRKLDDIVPTR